MLLNSLFNNSFFICTGSGSFRLRGKKFRFLVIPRYGTDLQTLLDQSGSTLSVDTACSIARQVVSSKLRLKDCVLNS